MKYIDLENHNLQTSVWLRDDFHFPIIPKIDIINANDFEDLRR